MKKANKLKKKETFHEGTFVVLSLIVVPHLADKNGRSGAAPTALLILHSPDVLLFRVCLSSRFSSRPLAPSSSAWQCKGVLVQTSTFGKANASAFSFQ